MDIVLQRYSNADAGRIGERIASIIDDAAFGICEWQDVVDALAGEFPGSAASCYSQEMSSNTVRFGVTANFNSQFVDTYERHFAFVNPWIEAWANAPNGAVLIAQEHMPIHLLHHTEFYNDWIRPHGDIEGSVGIGLKTAERDIIRLPVHYPLRFCELYDQAARQVLTSMRPALWRSVRLARVYREAMADISAASGVTGRGMNAAFVLDRHLRIREANEAAVALLAQGLPFSQRQGRVTLGAGESADFDAAVAGVLASATAPAADMVVANEDRVWKISIFRLPAAAGGATGLLGSVSLALVIARELSQAPEGDLEPFSDAFLLTPAETRLCAALAGGLSLAEAATRCAITSGTARDRLKNIFAKTGTSRQTELCLLLERFLGS